MKALIAILVTAGLVALGWKAAYMRTAAAEEVPESGLFTVARGDLGITVTENGYLKAKNSLKLKPEFKREGIISWLIEEGTEVAEGDVLIEFDKTELNNQLGELETSLIQFEMELEAGRADLKIQERDNEASVEKAELALELKNLALERYEKGDAPNERRQKVLAEEKARSEYERAQARFEQVPELVKEGFLTKSQEEEERIRLREAEIGAENAAKDLELYDTYTYPMELTTRQSEVKDATRELENAQIKASINLKEKQARVTQQERQVTSTKLRIEQLREELGKMTMIAPQPGTVHYGDPGRSWMRDQMKLGNRLRQGNTAITLPDLTVMQVLIEVHEADIDQVKLDMPVIVTVETHKGQTFPGKITEIDTVASSQSWDDGTNKTFSVEITMEPVEIEMRAGVTARAEVQVEKLEDVLQVPIYAVVPESEKHLCFALVNGKIEQRDVTVGKNNAHFVQILDGLVEGEQVLLYDPRESGVASMGQLDDEAESRGALPATAAEGD